MKRVLVAPLSNRYALGTLVCNNAAFEVTVPMPLQVRYQSNKSLHTTQQKLESLAEKKFNKTLMRNKLVFREAIKKQYHQDMAAVKMDSLPKKYKTKREARLAERELEKQRDYEAVSASIQSLYGIPVAAQHLHQENISTMQSKSEDVKTLLKEILSLGKVPTTFTVKKAEKEPSTITTVLTFLKNKSEAELEQQKSLLAKTQFTRHKHADALLTSTGDNNMNIVRVKRQVPAPDSAEAYRPDPTTVTLAKTIPDKDGYKMEYAKSATRKVSNESGELADRKSVV